MANDFKLSATLKGHEEDVRAIAFPQSDHLFSASRDNTIRHWNRTSTQPPTYDNTIVLQGQHWFNGLAYAPPSKQSPSGTIAAGGRETFVFVKHVDQSPEEDPHRLLIGHAGNITTLAFSQDGTKVVSGGWDSQVFVWDIEAGSVTAELTGHGGPLWGILVYDDKLIFTACADKAIRIFDIGGKLLHTIRGHTDVVRCFCKVPSEKWSGAAFASAGNDEVIRLWTNEGVPVAELAGHTAYIYSLAILPNGDIVSSSEDRTVKIWRDGDCIQTITHPAISIWAVAACPETGDIATGASDNIIRIFSRDPERQASAEAIKAFEDSNGMYAIPAETAAQGQPFEKENLPGPDALRTQTGQRDGQQLLIRENDGSVTAHLWSASTSQWNLIGTVVSGQGTASTNKVLNGKEYDFVFDIDIEDGKPPLKLPYNLSESSWDAARRFLEKNELPFTYYEQVANWITENTRGARITQSRAPTNQPTTQAHDPWGTERRYRPDSGPSSNTTSLPQRSYIQILEGNPANAIKILVQKSAELVAGGRVPADQSLNSEEVAALEALREQLQNKSNPRPTATQIGALLSIISAWPTQNKVPAVGILALLAVSPAFIEYTSEGTDIIQVLELTSVLSPGQSTANNVVHGLRLLVNLFKSAPGCKLISNRYDDILRAGRPFADKPESVAQAKALSTLYLNHATLLVVDTANQAREGRAKTLVTDIAVLLESDSPHAGDGDVLHRSLRALGTLLFINDGFRQELKGGISGTLHFVSIKPGAQQANVKEVVQEIRELLR